MKRHAKIDVAALLERIKAKGADALVSRAEATALIASRTMDARDTVRGARNRVGVQLDRAIDHGRAGYDIFSGGISPQPDGTFTADELGRWANRRYDNKFSDMPHAPRTVDCDCRETLGFAAKPDVILLPGNLERAWTTILQQRAENEELKSKQEQAARNRALGARFAKTKK